MPGVKVVLGVGFALLIAAIGVVLSRAPLVIAGTNSVNSFNPVALTSGDVSNCQPVGTIPKDTSTIRVSLASGAGPRLRLTVRSGSRVVSTGERRAGWGLEANVSVPVKKLTRAIRGAVICTAVGRAVEPVQIFGTALRSGSPTQLGLKDVNLRIEYLRTGPRSWWSLLSSVSHRMGLGRAASGRWLSFLVLLTMIAVAALSARLTLRELR